MKHDRLLLTEANVCTTKAASVNRGKKISFCKQSRRSAFVNGGQCNRADEYLLRRLTVNCPPHDILRRYTMVHDRPPGTPNPLRRHTIPSEEKRLPHDVMTSPGLRWSARKLERQIIQTYRIFERTK